jgi:hypothetical protein
LPTRLVGKFDGKIDSCGTEGSESIGGSPPRSGSKPPVTALARFPVTPGNAGKEIVGKLPTPSTMESISGSWLASSGVWERGLTKLGTSPSMRLPMKSPAVTLGWGTEAASEVGVGISDSSPSITPGMFILGITLIGRRFEGIAGLLRISLTRLPMSPGLETLGAARVAVTSKFESRLLTMLSRTPASLALGSTVGKTLSVASFESSPPIPPGRRGEGIAPEI